MDIFRFRKNARSQERRESLRCHELDCAAEPCFEQLCESQKTAVRLRAGGELDKKVDIAIETGLAARNGTKQSEPLHAECADLRLRGSQPLDRLFSGKRRAGHSITILAHPAP